MSALLTPTVALVAIAAVAAIVPLAFRRWPRLACIAPAATSAACFALFLAWLAPVARGTELVESWPWIPSLGVFAGFRLDGLSLVFALLVTGIGAIVLAYSPAYLDRGPRTGQLLGLLLAFEASMLGLVLADDTITLFVFWELTTFTSFFLIAFDSTAELARTRARQALVITAGGGLALLVGLVLLAGAARPDGPGLAVALSALDGTSLREHASYVPIVILVAVGAFTKSAQVPFHFWLPGAMVAPSPVSAYLHSATMVKAGVYLLARLHPHLGGTPLWITLLAAVGATTFVTGAVIATVQRDAKLSLAYATVSVLGALTMLLGIGTSYAIGGAVLLLVAHACYKAALFLTTGNLYHHRGTRDPFAPLRARRDMPVTAAIALVAAASMAGIPPLVGFIAKDAVIAATLEGTTRVALAVASVLAGAGLVAAAWLAGIAPYSRGRAPWSRGDVARPMLVGPGLLALAGLALGLVPSLIAEPLVAPAVRAIAGHPVSYDVVLWPGLAGVHGLAFALGAGSIALGSAIAVVVWRWRDPITVMREHWQALSGARVHEALLGALARGAAAVARTVQHGRLPLYIGTVVAAMSLVVAAPLVWSEPTLQAALEPTGYEIPALIVAAVGAIAATIFRDRLSSVAALAAVGLAVVFLFALFSGPDLAITQIVVETMMVILLVLVFRRLPPSHVRERPGGKLVRLLVACGAGALLAALLVVATSVAAYPTTASSEQIQIAAREDMPNVVNAILVNFRALDTLGEITVIAIAGIGVAALAVRERRR